MTDQCINCTLKGNWEGCKATECFHHENWGWQQLERDNADLKRENERLTQKTLDQFVEIQDLRRVANDLSAEVERLKQELEETQLQALDDMCRCD